MGSLSVTWETLDTFSTQNDESRQAQAEWPCTVEPYEVDCWLGVEMLRYVVVLAEDYRSEDKVRSGV